MATPLKRRILSEHLLMLLRTSLPDNPIGDHEATYEEDLEQEWNGGWQGEHGNSTFIPYSVLYSQPGTRIEGGLDVEEIVGLPYMMVSVGSDRRQTEWMSDSLREAVASIKRDNAVPGWRIERVQITQYGGAEPDLTQEPPLLYARDVFLCLMTRRPEVMQFP